MIAFRSLTLSPQLLFKGYFVRHLLRIYFIGAYCPFPHTRQTISELLQTLSTDFC